MDQRLPRLPRQQSLGHFARLRSELYCRGSQPGVNLHVQDRSRRPCSQLEHRWAIGLCNPLSDRGLDKPALFNHGMVDGTLVLWNTHRRLSSIGGSWHSRSSPQETLNMILKRTAQAYLSRGVRSLSLTGSLFSMMAGNEISWTFDSGP